MSEKDYEQGYRMAAISILQKVLSDLRYYGDEVDHSKWIIERETAISTLRSACKEFGDNDWDFNLYLSDIIDKHLIRPKLRYLANISVIMKGQDNMMTSEPIYVVQDRRRIMGMDTAHTGQITWLHDCEEVTDLEDEDLKAAIAHFEEHGEEPPGWDRTGYIDIWQDVQPFFSLKGAEEYIKVRSRHLNHPRVYVKSGFDNPEWKAVRALLTTQEE